MPSNIISFEPIVGNLHNVIYSKEPSIINPKMRTEQLEKIFSREPYNFETAFELAKRYVGEGQYEKACEVRFRAANEALESLPEEDEEFELEWENEENQEFIEMLAASGADFYMYGDFEMSAALFETVLALDSQDHLDVTPQLAMSYLAIEDYEGYDMVKADFTPGTMVSSLVENFAAYRQGRKPVEAMSRELAAEISAINHDVDDSFFDEADKDRVTKEVAARELWYKHLPVFETFADFTDKFRK